MLVSENTPPPKMWQIPSLRGEPDLGPLERAYRQQALPADVSQIVGIGWIYIVALFIYAFIDYQLFGPSTTLITLYAARGIMLVFSLTTMLILKRTTSYVVADWLVLTWTAAAAGFALYVHFTRPESFFANTLVDLIFVIVFYTATPNRFHFRLIPALLLSLGDVGLLWSMRGEMSVVDVRAVTTALLLGNVTGMVISVHLYTYRRNQFVAQHQERLARQEIEALATIDMLTQTLNRRRFMELAGDEFQRFRRYQHPFSLLLIDLDHFKRVNDSFGHSAGDAVLKGFATLVRSLIRQSDLLGRLGGEEFAIILPETPAGQALQLAERICEQCEQMQLPTRGGVVQVTTSIGVTEVQGNDTSPEDTFHRADQALYHVKEHGRNGAHLIGAH